MTLADRRDDGREVVRRRMLHEGQVFDLVGEEVRLGPDDAEPVLREFVDHPGAVAVVALREGPDGEEVAVVDQYRHPVRAVLWEIPAGLLDVAGEDPRDAAARELREEGDLEADAWQDLGSFALTPGGSSEHIRIFLATGVRASASAFARGDEEADIRAEWVPLAEAVRAVEQGRMANAALAIGVLLAARRLSI